MNPSKFYGSNVEEDHQGFIDEVYKVFDITGVTSEEKKELVTWQLNDVAKVFYDK